MNELNFDVEAIRAKVMPIVDGIIEKAEKTPDEAPFAHHLTNDVQLALFFLICVDFVNSTPNAMVNAEAVTIKGDMAMLTLPIPMMFEAYYDMRLKKLAADEPMTPEDSIETPMPVTGVAGNNEQIVTSTEVEAERNDNGD